jgi:hypothetical protein
MATVQGAAQFTQAQRKRVLAHLDEILNSAPFAGARRRQAFLRYVVEETLAGRGHSIKETNIAVDVFERTDFDAQSASIVRVTGWELRKRLAQAYASGIDADVRIELPVGTYQPTIEFIAAAAAPVEAPLLAPAPIEVAAAPVAHRWSWGTSWWNWRALAAALLLTGVVTAFAYLRPKSPIDRLWQPFIGQSRPVLIYVASRRVLAVNDADKWLPLRPGESIPTSVLDESDASWVGSGGAYGATFLAERLGQQGQPFVLKFGNDLSFADMKNSPSILIGASRWTSEFTRGLRFRLVNEAGMLRISDSQNPDHGWAIPAMGRSDRSSGYSIVTRLIRSESGQPVLLIAGMDARNTMAAIDFVAHEDDFNEFAKSAPAGWEKKSFQLVLSNTIHGNSPGKLTVVATHLW